MRPEERGTLRKELGLLDAVGIGFGAIIGAGIFVVIGVAAGIAGAGLLASLLIGALAATANALSSAQLAAAYPQTGGTYEYGYRVLNPTLGFAAGWLFLASKIAAAGAVALGLSGYLGAILPGVPPRLMAVTCVLVFTALNYFGIRRSSRANLAIVAVSIGTLLLFVVAGIPRLNTEILREVVGSDPRRVLQGAAILFFAYTGYARIATLAEEVRDPARTIPRAIIITIAGAVILYIAVAAVALSTAGSDGLASTGAPLHLAAGLIGGSFLQATISIGALTAMLGVILSQLLGLSRMAFAMARRGDLPSILSHVSPRHGVPDRAVLVIGAVAALVAATSTLSSVAAAASFAILGYYAIANLAALRMPAPLKLYHDSVAWFGLSACVLLALFLPQRVIVTGVLILLAGFAGRALIRRGIPAGSD